MQPIIRNDGTQAYRTKLLPQDQAERFARCLKRNPRFEAIEVQRSSRAKKTSEAAFFVSFAPVSDASRERLFQDQWNSRKERAEEEGAQYEFWQDPDAEFYWCFNPISGETYEVTIFSCSCPDYRYRCEGLGILCKHEWALSEFLRRKEEARQTAREERRTRLNADLDF